MGDPDKPTTTAEVLTVITVKGHSTELSDPLPLVRTESRAWISLIKPRKKFSGYPSTCLWLWEDNRWPGKWTAPSSCQKMGRIWDSWQTSVWLMSVRLSRIYWDITVSKVRTVVQFKPREKGFVFETECFNNVHILSELLRQSKDKHRALVASCWTLAKLSIPFLMGRWH